MDSNAESCPFSEVPLGGLLQNAGKVFVKVSAEAATDLELLASHPALLNFATRFYPEEIVSRAGTESNPN
jgi:hypothetical protein